MDLVGVKFVENGRVYNFTSNIDLDINDNVIVETEKGCQYGTITKKVNINNKNVDNKLKQVIRKCTFADQKQHEKNIHDCKKILEKVKKTVTKYKLDLNIIEVSYTFEREQLIIVFSSEKRVDFRDLVKELASIYKTRIEMHQLNPREKSKRVGGFGICGCKLCCTKFKSDYDTTNINMAKNQNVSLNPNKINGLCGRLMCCLKYEDDNYKNCRLGLPEVGEKINKKSCCGVVRSVDILNRTYTVETKNDLVKVSLDERN